VVILVCCLLISFISGLLLGQNLMGKTDEPKPNYVGSRKFMSMLSDQNNTFSLMSLVLLLFISSKKSTNFFSQE